MGVYIPKMALPKTCRYCPFCNWEDITWCGRANYLVCDGIVDPDGKPEWCDLIHVPDHGELIDKTGVSVLSWTEDEKKDFTDGVLFVLDKLDELPVLIPADEDGDGDV